MIIETPETCPDAYDAVNRFEAAGIPSIFLGGTIDQGNSEDWQTRITQALSKYAVGLFNPRRANWDASWKQDPREGTPFCSQVTWELETQEAASLRVYYFADGSASPVTLLELGLFSMIPCVVRCTPNFYRYGNVKLICERYGIQVFEEDTELIDFLKSQLTIVN